MTDPGWDALIDEGYDPKGPLGPTYWRIVKRDPELLYLSTAPIPRESVFKGWGYEGLAYCDLLTGIGIVRLETFLKLAETQKHWPAMLQKYRLTAGRQKAACLFDARQLRVLIAFAMPSSPSPELAWNNDKKPSRLSDNPR
jgi:hypothetical protein